MDPFADIVVVVVVVGADAFGWTIMVVVVVVVSYDAADVTMRNDSYRGIAAEVVPNDPPDHRGGWY